MVTIMREGTELTHKQYGNFVKGVRALGPDNVASDAQVIYTRNQTPLGEGAWNMSGFTRGARIYVPHGKSLLVRNSPLLDISEAQKAVGANSKGERYFVNSEFYEGCLAQAKRDKTKRPSQMQVMTLPFRETSGLSSDSHFDVLEFIAGGKVPARKYNSNLQTQGIDGLMFWMPHPVEVDQQRAPYIGQGWLDNLTDESGLGADSYLHYDIELFGVRSPDASKARPRHRANS